MTQSRAYGQRITKMAMTVANTNEIGTIIDLIEVRMGFQRKYENNGQRFGQGSRSEYEDRRRNYLRNTILSKRDR